MNTLKTFFAAFCIFVAGSCAASAASFKVTSSGEFGVDLRGVTRFDPARDYSLSLSFSVDQADVLTDVMGTFVLEGFGSYSLTNMFRAGTGSNGDLSYNLASPDFSFLVGPLGDLSGLGFTVNVGENPFTSTKTLATLFNGSDLTYIRILQNNSAGASYYSFNVNSGSVVAVTDTPAVPLPAAGWALLTALGGLTVLRRRASKRA